MQLAHARHRAARELADAADARAWSGTARVIVLYVLLLGTMMPLYLLSARHLATGMMVVALLHAAIISWFVHASALPLRRLLRPTVGLWRWMAIAAVAVAVLLPVNLAYHDLLRSMLGGDATPRADSFRLAGHPRWIEYVFTAVMPAVWEELAFRGVIHAGLEQVVGIRQALVVGALLFAVLHCAFLSIPYLALIGLVLGYVRWKSGSLLPGMSMHFTHNAILVAWGAP